MSEPTPGLAQRETPAAIRMFFAVLAVFWVYRFVPEVRSLVAGAPDHYHNEHWRSVTIIGGSLALAIGMTIKHGRLGWLLLLTASAVLVVSVALAR